MRVLLSAVAAIILSIPVTDAKDDLDAYPKPQAGQQCWTVKLPKIDREKLCKVEIIVGANLLLDPKNLYFLGGHIERKRFKGLTYYVVKRIGPLVGTKMAVPPGTKKVKRFIALGGVPYLIPYNSKQPIVVYLPQGTDARYRIWRAGEIKEMVLKK